MYLLYHTDSTVLFLICQKITYSHICIIVWLHGLENIIEIKKKNFYGNN